MGVYVIVTAVALGGVAGFCSILAWLLRAPSTVTVDREWLERFRVGRYRHLQRLFAQTDYDFLAAEPGFSAGVARNLRRRRKQVMKLYLRRMSHDFDRLYLAGRAIALASSCDRPDLTRDLLVQRAVFRLALLRVRLVFALNSLGVGHIDVAPVIGRLEHAGSSIAPARPIFATMRV